MRRLSLLQRFAVVSLLLVLLIGIVLTRLLSHLVSERALQSAADAAALSAAVAIQPLIAEDDLVHRLPAETVAALDETVGRFSGSSEIARIKIWHHDGDLLYLADPHTHQPGVVAQQGGGSHAMEHALEGEVEAEIITDSSEPGNAALLQRYGSLFEVYVPITYGSGKVVGVFELYLPYEPVRDQIRRDSLAMSAMLALGLAVLWAGLFRTVSTASRRLRRESARNDHQARHDALTGLPNRTALLERIDHDLTRRDAVGSAALVLLDLNRFREVNDTLGHGHGDALLREVAKRLREHIGERGVVARLGGDEFAVYLPDAGDVLEAGTAAAAMREMLRTPIEVDDVPVIAEPSAGVSRHPADASDATEMLQHADVALYVAKRGHRGVAVYDPADDEHSPQRLRLLADLADALDAGDLVLHYQPKCRLDGTTVGVEALVRWAHPERGLLAPVEFVPDAERTGLIHRLTDVVLAAALTQARAWLDCGTPTQVAVNVSTRTLLDPGFAERVLAALSTRRVPADLLMIEITETTIMEDPERARTVLTALADAGVALSIDDFGTGYSSLAYLKSLPVHELKIDRSFVAAMTRSAADRVIVESTVALGRRLGLDVVAEGVEDDETRAALDEIGCPLAQGFHFARPVPAEALRLGRDREPAAGPTHPA
jgi:diguanylate cyclase (GGDEF)-like protein